MVAFVFVRVCVCACVCVCTLSLSVAEHWPKTVISTTAETYVACLLLREWLWALPWLLLFVCWFAFCVLVDMRWHFLV